MVEKRVTQQGKEIIPKTFASLSSILKDVESEKTKKIGLTIDPVSKEQSKFDHRRRINAIQCTYRGRYQCSYRGNYHGNGRGNYCGSFRGNYRGNGRGTFRGTYRGRYNLNRRRRGNGRRSSKYYVKIPKKRNV